MPSHRQPGDEAQRKPSNANLGQQDAKREKVSKSKLSHMEDEERSEADQPQRPDAKNRRSA